MVLTGTAASLTLLAIILNIGMLLSLFFRFSLSSLSIQLKQIKPNDVSRDGVDYFKTKAS